ncbi:unnamed protein product, partial [Symbiodinium microadriaticum]
LQQLIENSVDVNISDYDARTALHLAATEGQLLAVSFLISSARASWSCSALLGVAGLCFLV